MPMPWQGSSRQRPAETPVGRRSTAPLPASFTRPEHILGQLAGAGSPAQPARSATSHGSWTSREAVSESSYRPTGSNGQLLSRDRA